MSRTHFERGKMSDGARTGLAWLVFAVGVCALLVAIGMGWAHFRLWKAEYVGQALKIEKEYKGKAILAEATFARQARVEAAIAEEDAAQHTANAIAIVGAAAQEYPEYRQQEFYMALGDALKEGTIEQIIYLPTEAGLPLTEAGKR